MLKSVRNMSNWKSLPCDISELRLDITLACGQSFRWKELRPGEWTSVLAGKVWTLTQNDKQLLYRVYEKSDVPVTSIPSTGVKLELNEETCNKDNDDKTKIKLEVEDERKLSSSLSSSSSQDCSSILSDYLQLRVSVKDLYTQWNKADSHFKSVAADFSGVRMLRQDPVENLFSFICSSNNHISRISGMVERMCEKYGEKVVELDGKMYHSFPTIVALAGEDVEQTLRELGFGYRAKFISKSARHIMEKEEEGWLMGLREKPYEEAHAQLIKLCGVGAKVADCVCLMSLDQPGAIPVDTHVWQIASRDYMPHLKQNKSITDTIYKSIGNRFRELWGEYAGWAHSVLFSADLKKFQDLKSGQDSKQIKEEGKKKSPKKRGGAAVKTQGKKKR